MTELTEQDKQRIEQEAKNSCNHWDIGLPEWIKGAEYATRFEREQFAELIEQIQAMYIAGLPTGDCQAWDFVQHAKRFNEYLNSLKTK